MADMQAIAGEFTKFYYQTFDTGRANLITLYVSGSRLKQSSR
jgi:hypothetical protein